MTEDEEMEFAAKRLGFMSAVYASTGKPLDTALERYLPTVDDSAEECERKFDAICILLRGKQ